MNSERHLHPVAMLVGAIRTLRRWIGGLVFPGVLLLLSQGFSLRTVALLLLAILVGAALAALWGFLSWRATTYAVTGNSFRLKQGVLQKNERTIPLDHVQSVDTVQGICSAPSASYEVRIETAGGGASEPDASLSALAREAAQTLRLEIEGSQRERSEEAEGPTVIRRALEAGSAGGGGHERPDRGRLLGARRGVPVPGRLPLGGPGQAAARDSGAELADGALDPDPRWAFSWPGLWQ